MTSACGWLAEFEFFKCVSVRVLIADTCTFWERGTRTLLEQCFAEARGYGFGLVAVDQQPSL
jgi:hypothetical protein